MKALCVAAVFVALVATAPAAAQVDQTFPRVRLGSGAQPTSGSGFVANDTYTARRAAIAWSRATNDLTLYLLPGRKRVTCSNLRRLITAPGHLIQVHVTDQRHVPVRQQISTAQVAFLTTFKDPTIPTKVAGLREGAHLMFTRVDSFPRGVWHGYFAVAKRVYGDGKRYGFSGTFAATFCQLAK